MRRIDNLTGVRAYAALWVVLLHVQAINVNHFDLGRIVAHGYFGVDVFFVLSGLMLTLVYRLRSHTFSLSWYRLFLQKRVAKIYPLHLATFVATAALLAGSNPFATSYRTSIYAPENTWWSAACNVLLIHGWGLTRRFSWNIFSWSISAEWFAYLFLFPLFLFGLRRWPPPVMIGLSALCWPAYLLFCHYGLHVSPELLTRGALRIVPEFLAGYTLAHVVGSVPGAGDWWSLGGLLLIVVCCVTPASFLLLMPAVAVLLTGCYKGGNVTDAVFGNRVAVALGEASYSIYMIQLAGILIANVLARRLNVRSPEAVMMTALAEFVGITVFGLGTYHIFEEPTRRGLLRIFNGWSHHQGRSHEGVGVADHAVRLEEDQFRPAQ